MSITSLKDTDRVLINTVLEAKNDKDLLNLLATNKSLLRLGEEVLKQRMYKTYPILASRKPFFENWRSYYLKTVYYINKLKEEFNVDYIPTPSFDPEGFYNGLHFMKVSDDNYSTRSINHAKYRYMIFCLAEYGDENMIMKYVDVSNPIYKKDLVDALSTYKRLDLLDKILRENSQFFDEDAVYDIIFGAGASNDPEYFEYVLNRYRNINDLPEYKIVIKALSGASSIEMINYLFEKYPNSMKKQIVYYTGNKIYGAAKRDNVDFLNNFIVDPSFIDIFPDEIRRFLTNSESNGLLLKPSFLSDRKKIEALNALINSYYRTGGTKEMLRKELKLKRKKGEVKDPVFIKYLEDNQLYI